MRQKDKTKIFLLTTTSLAISAFIIYFPFVQNESSVLGVSTDTLKNNSDVIFAGILIVLIILVMIFLNRNTKKKERN